MYQQNEIVIKIDKEMENVLSKEAMRSLTQPVPNKGRLTIDSRGNSLMSQKSFGERVHIQVNDSSIDVSQSQAKDLRKFLKQLTK